MEYDDIEKVILLCKKYGITSFDAEGVKFKFAESNLTPPESGFQLNTKNLNQTIDALEKGVMPSDDKMLFAASEGLEEEDEK